MSISVILIAVAVVALIVAGVAKLRQKPVDTSPEVTTPTPNVTNVIVGPITEVTK